MLDQGKKFMEKFLEIMTQGYGGKKRPIMVGNLQANNIIERVHQTIENIIKSFEVHVIAINEQDPWTWILSAVRFATRATVHTITQAAAMQLVFGRDAILNVKHEADWNYIKRRRESLIRKNNEQGEEDSQLSDWRQGPAQKKQSNQIWNQCIQCTISNRTNQQQWNSSDKNK